VLQLAAKTGISTAKSGSSEREADGLRFARTADSSKIIAKNHAEIATEDQLGDQLDHHGLELHGQELHGQEHHGLDQTGLDLTHGLDQTRGPRTHNHQAHSPPGDQERLLNQLSVLTATKVIVSVETNLKGSPHVMKVDGATRCFTVYQPRGATKQPVVLSSQCYAKDRLMGIQMMSERIDANVAAKRYGYARIGLSTPDGGWTFGNDGVVNDKTPRPCSDKDSKDIPYLKAVFKFIESNPQKFDASKIFAEGFSQNSMFSAYIGFCFPEKILGIWQGGSGMALTGQRPFLPGCEGQVRASIFKRNKPCQRAVQSYPCKECQYWPIYPCYTPKRPMVDCVAEYTNDFVSVDRQDSSKDSGKYMYEKLKNEGHDGRLLVFSPTNGVRGGHSNPQNAAHWQAGCMGITPSCTAQCEKSFVKCVGSQGSWGFKSCIAESSMKKLSGCTSTCSPTLNMLKTSENPKEVKLSRGKFGSAAKLQARPDTSKCQA